MIHFPHNAKHGKKESWQQKAGHFRKELLDQGITTTHEAILKGLRTGTTRFSLQSVVEGEMINVGRTDTTLPAIVTKVYNKTLKELFLNGEMTPEDWSKREGWTVEYLKDNPKVLDKYPFDFKLL